MKNLLAYTPEPFENLEIMDAEYDALVGEGEMDEEVVRSRGTRGIRRPGGRRAGRVPMLSKRVKPVKPFRPKFPMRPLMPAVPVPFPYSNALTPANNAAADSSRPYAGQSAGGEGSFANTPAQDVASEHVRWVQETLNRALGLRLIVDGIMNRETRSAVRMFQERKGLPVTGLVGPDTEDALRAEGGQAAAEPELLEGEWEMPDSGECSCGGREMEEFVFEAEPFGEAEFEDEFEVAKGRVISYSEVGNDRFSVPAQESLMRMSKDPAKSADAVGLLEAVKSGRLLGIWCVNWKASSDRAQQHGSTWWDVIPKGEDAVLMLDPVNPLAGAPLIAFRRTLDTRPDKGCGILPKETTPSYLPQRLDAALIRAWWSYIRLRQGKVAPCLLLNKQGFRRTSANRTGTREPTPPSDPIVPRCCNSTLSHRIRLSLFDFVPSFASGFRFLHGKPVGYTMDTDLLNAFATARIDDYSLVHTITFNGNAGPPKWGKYFTPLGNSSEVMRVDYLQQLTFEMHSRGAQVLVGYEMVERGTTVSSAGAAFRSWLISATDAQIRSHAQAIVDFFSQRGIIIDGIGFDIELNGLSSRHSPKLAMLFAETAKAMAIIQPGGIVYYDTAPFQPNDGEGTVQTMAPLRYALAIGSPNLIARPMCYNGTITPRSIITASINCALRATTNGGGGLAGSQLQPAIDISRTSDAEIKDMCKSLLRPRGVGMTIYTMPSGRLSQKRLLARAQTFDAVLNPRVSNPSFF